MKLSWLRRAIAAVNTILILIAVDGLHSASVTSLIKGIYITIRTHSPKSTRPLVSVMYERNMMLMEVDNKSTTTQEESNIWTHVV